MAVKPKPTTIANQPSWVVASDRVELAVTALGGHMAPVTFRLAGGRKAQPYFISPWQSEGRKITEPVLVPLRGDFFCMPFGGGSYRGRSYLVHGEPASKKWRLAGMDRRARTVTLTLSIRTRAPAGKITKYLSLVDGQTVVYCRHELEGFTGRFPLGHHATLAMPDRPGSIGITTSNIRLGLTFPVEPGRPAEGEYYAAAVAGRFDSLLRVPSIWKTPTHLDFTRRPGPAGFCDIVGVFHKTGRTPAWTTAVFEPEGYLWFSLKDPAVLPTLTIWSENRGRHTEPWDGRTNCLGLEDGCAYLAAGMGPSLGSNPASRAGAPTAIRLSPKSPTAIRYIQGVAKIPRSFGKTRTVKFTPGKVTFISTTGKKASAMVCHKFLNTGEI
ncbi:MAG: hypothetical protein SVT52_03930 [Planctomycetota bacterium]|nr:hypothetical protein [Planctomycetota bacterium]